MDFNKLIENNKNNVKNIIRLITKEYNEDLEQEVYIKAWQNSHKYQEQGKFKSWINTIAKNISKDYLKSAKVRYETKTPDDDLTFNSIKDKKLTPEQVFISKQRQKRITKAINELKPKFKEVIIMYEMQDVSYEQISEKLKCPVGTVRSRLFTARKELSLKLEDLI